MILTIFRRAFGVTLGDDGLPPADCGRSVPEESERKKKNRFVDHWLFFSLTRLFPIQSNG